MWTLLYSDRLFVRVRLLSLSHEIATESVLIDSDWNGITVVGLLNFY